MLTAQATTIHAKSDHPIAVELDGETSGALPARFDIKKGALTIRGGWSVS
jgi:diacylglycerol kinase family enzyme